MDRKRKAFKWKSRRPLTAGQWVATGWAWTTYMYIARGRSRIYWFRRSIGKVCSRW